MDEHNGVVSNQSNGNVTQIATSEARLTKSRIWELLRPRRQPIWVEAVQSTWVVQAMSAAQRNQMDASQAQTVRLKQDGTAEYDVHINQLRAVVVAENTYWPDGKRVFDDPTDAIMLAESDNSVISLLYGAIDEMSSTTKEQLDAAKKGSPTTHLKN